MYSNSDDTTHKVTIRRPQNKYIFIIAVFSSMNSYQKGPLQTTANKAIALTAIPRFK